MILSFRDTLQLVRDKNNIIVIIQSIPKEMLRKIIISYRYNNHNLQDNQPSNLNNKLTNQLRRFINIIN